jgi:hypothetical protein
MNKNTFAANAKREAAIRGGSVTINGDIIEPLNEKSQKILDSYTYYVETYTARLNRLSLPDSHIMYDATTVGFAPFMDGKKTADEAAKDVQSKVALYLSE